MVVYDILFGGIYPVVFISMEYLNLIDTYLVLIYHLSDTQ